jgi:hypothetical protein
MGENRQNVDLGPLLELVRMHDESARASWSSGFIRSLHKSSMRTCLAAMSRRT